MIFRIKGVRTTWVQLYIPQEVLNRIKDKKIIHKIFRTQGDDSILFGYFCIDFMEYTLFPNDYTKNDKVIYNYFKDKYGKSRI